MTPKTVHVSFALLLVFLVFFSFGTDLAKVKNGGFFSDESTYFSIAQSLAHDGDLEYTRDDIRRIRASFANGPMGLFLKQAKDGRLYYAKSFIYPLALAPFFRLFASHGILLANSLMLFLTLLMGFLLLRRLHPPGRSFLFTALYLLGSVTFVYVWWITADLFNFFVNFAALFFFFYPFKRPAWAGLAGVFFAAAVFSKPNNLLHVGVLFLLLLRRRQWRRFLALGLVCALVLAGLFAFNFAQTGEWNYQGGERRSFYGNFPLERPDFQFAGGNSMTTDTYMNRLYLTPAIALYNAFYYVFGRFTGMLIYFFPAVFLLLLALLRRKSTEDRFLLAAIGLAVLCYILLMPDNYFGGGGSLGNRYFLSVYPLFFFLGVAGPQAGGEGSELRFRFIALPAAAAAVFLAPLALNGLFNSAYPRFPGLSLPARLFPPEKTQYATLPSNTNPRAFHRKIGERLTLFFLNDHYHAIEGQTFWTYADKELELFLLAPERAGSFVIQLKNIPVANQAWVQLEHRRRAVFLEPGGVRSLRFRNIPGLRIGGERRLYHLRIRSQRSHCPYFAQPGAADRRLLGVQVQIQIED